MADDENDVLETDESNNWGEVWTVSLGGTNGPPVLSNYDGLPGGVDPDEGTWETTFTFRVHYSVPEGTAPTVAQVVIDGQSYAMSGSGDDSDYSVALLGTNLGYGTHDYHFYFEDSCGMGAILPDPGDWQFTVIQGPAEPIAYWCFDDCTPTDCSRLGMNGVNYGAACAAGLPGQAYEFIGADLVRYIPSSWDNSVTTAFTVAAKVKWYGPNEYGSWSYIFDGRDDYWDHAGFIPYVDWDEKVRLHMNQSGSGVVGTTSVPMETWTHVAVVFDDDADVLRPFVNGMPEAPMSTTAVYHDSSLQPAIGSNRWAPGDGQWAPFNGVIDELCIYDRALSAVEVCELAGNTVDCNSNGIPDCMDIVAGTSRDCQFNGILDDCETVGNDCNAHTVPDECDIASGTSQDCQPNSIPDECDLAAGTSLDADGNGTPDECEGPNYGLVAYWPFDEGDGSVTHDDSGHGNDGTIYGVTWTTGTCGSALVFDGAHDYVAAGPFTQFGGTQPFSLCAWIRRTTIGGEEPYILNNMYSSWAGIGLFSDGYTTGVTVGGANGGPGQVTVFDHENIADGLWHLIVGTYDGSELVLYVDGEWRGRNSDFSYYTASTWNMNIGRMEQGARYYFDGSIDEARIYDRASSVGEILELYAQCAPDCNSNGLPDACDVDCDKPGGACDLPGSGQSSDCDSNSIPDECEPDCNGNGIPDRCDLLAGTSQDCQPNGIPDECDIAAGTSQDCNANGIQTGATSPRAPAWIATPTASPTSARSPRARAGIASRMGPPTRAR